MPKHDGDQPILVYSTAFEMTTILEMIRLCAFIEAQPMTRPRANFDPRALSQAQDHHWPQGSHQGGDKSHFSICVQERHEQLRDAPQEMHGAEWWSSRASALEYTRTD